MDTKNFAKASDIFTDLTQIKAYLKEINNFDEFRIVQQARTGITLDGLKKAFQTSLKRNDYEVFDVIWDNANLRNDIWNNLPSTLTPQIKIQYKNIFKQSVDNALINDKIFDIIKITF